MSADDHSSPEAREPRRQLLLVSDAEGVIALRAASVVEVITARPYARIPGTAESIAGLVNKRGRILTVVDLGLAMGSASSTAIPGHRIVVLTYAGRELGLAVRDVLQIADDPTDVPEMEMAEEERASSVAEVPRDGRVAADRSVEQAGTESSRQFRIVELRELLGLYFEDGSSIEEPTFERS